MRKYGGAIGEFHKFTYSQIHIFSSYSQILTFSTQRYAYYIKVVQPLTIRKPGIVYDFIFIKRSEIMCLTGGLAGLWTSKLL